MVCSFPKGVTHERRKESDYHQVFIGDAMAVKHLGEAMHDKIGQKKLTTQHIKDTLDEQSGAG